VLDIARLQAALRRATGHELPTVAAHRRATEALTESAPA
jgi:hypothetical protein